MGTRRWIVNLESWLQTAGLSKEELAARTGHSDRVLPLFSHPEPNLTLDQYLDLAEKAGARFHGVLANNNVMVFARLKEIMAREKITSISALAKIADINRSQLSTMLNHPDPNPTMETFDRLVVALGAERDFLLVKQRDQEVEQAIAAGNEEMRAAVAAKQQEARSHLHVVPPPAPTAPPDEQWRYRRAVENANRAAEAAQKELRAKYDELNARVESLYRSNVALERQRDDQAAEIVRLRGQNATLERLRAEQAAEIGRLTQDNIVYQAQHQRDLQKIASLSAAQDMSVGEKFLLGLGGLALGVGIGVAWSRASKGPDDDDKPR